MISQIFFWSGISLTGLFLLNHIYEWFKALCDGLDVVTDSWLKVKVTQDFTFFCFTILVAAAVAKYFGY